MAFVEKSGQLLADCEVVTEQVKAMVSVTGKKAIVVSIDTYGNMRDVNRDDKLVQDFREFDVPIDEGYSKMKGTEFADFVSGTLVPYVQQHYNVYTDTLHNAIAGVSLGGLEAFYYITLEYPEIFGTVGALSPSFLYIDSEVWDHYLSTKSFDENFPFLFFYTGPEGGDTDPDVTQMYSRLLNMGYPEDKLALHFNENGTHSTNCWRNVFSEFLTAMMFQRIEPLQQ